ncbi:unnamed protein product [Mytilus coruscus]|uniref:Uncharacterized protein n=1 Tax=Mytilus coruscus TaxID=42192 RepID=A0A6J8A4R1_MYTCO|nr:unnamed protein product [Mytilus coruscus]
MIPLRMMLRLILSLMQQKNLAELRFWIKDYECSLMYSDTTVVSFMYIPAFIDDDDIIDMLRDRGIKIVSPVFRRVVPGYAEIVAKGNDEYDIDSIIKRYRSLQSALPELWTNTVGTEVYHRTNNRKIDINLNMNCELVDFKMCSSKQLYCLVIDKLCQQPKSVDKWMNIFQEDESIMHKMENS